jgi:hypothetical protein
VQKPSNGWAYKAKDMGMWLRGIGAQWRMLPHFIIAGVQKGGTTSLYAYLDQHPDMKLSRPKEVHFFDEQYHRGLAYYRRVFPFAWRGLITGEASPYYFFHPLVPQRVCESLPGVKVIVLLRNPIMRAYSHYHMQRRAGVEPLESFDEAVAAEAGRLEGEEHRILTNGNYIPLAYKRYSYVARGMYHVQAQRWIGALGREQILFVKSEHLLQDPEKELCKVYDFIGVNRVLPAMLPQKHVGEYPAMAQTTRDYLQAVFAQDQERLVQLLGPDFGWF